MTLNGTKLISASVLSLLATITQAETIAAPALTTFTAGTPAKAAEVNANFTGLKTYGTALNEVVNAQAALIQALEAKVAALESITSNDSDEFAIAVHGDGELIGYTNKVLHNFDKPFIQVKTTYGMATIRGVQNSATYYLDGFDELTSSASSSTQVYFTDSSCTLNPSQLITYENNIQLFFTAEANIIDANKFISDGNTSYLIEAGTTVTKTTSESDLYIYNTWSNSCDSFTVPSGTLVIPAVALSEAVHGLKSTYNNITIEGYAAPL